MKKKTLINLGAVASLLTLLSVPLVYGAAGFPSSDEPKFKKGDTVMQRKSQIIYILDSVTYRRSGKQVFYNAHGLNGNPVTWLPENSIKPLPKY